MQQAVQLATLQRGYGQGRDLVDQLLGQAQGFSGSGRSTPNVRVSKLAIVRKTSNLPERSSRTVRSCRAPGPEPRGLLGISDDKANQDMATCKPSAKEEALEQMQRVGIGYRDLRQFRRLPLDQKSALIEAAKER